MVIVLPGAGAEVNAKDAAQRTQLPFPIQARVVQATQSSKRQR